MFRKLVSNLPFNPSLIHQVGFYADRLRQERSIRRLSFVFMALAMVVQSLAVISPPERSLAASSTNLMNGLQTKQDILAYYDNPNSETKAIFEHYNISRQDLVNLPDRPRPEDTIFTGDGNDWWTVGIYSLNQRPDVKQPFKDAERAVQYRPGRYVYERQWQAFDIRNPDGQNRAAWRGVSSATGQTFWIVQSCGNITWINTWDTPPPPAPTPVRPIPPKPTPSVDIEKSINKKGPLNPGDSFSYRFSYRNEVQGSNAAQNVKITDAIDTRYLNPASSSKYSINASGTLTYDVGSLPYKEGNKYQVLTVPVTIKNQVPRDLEICNDGATISSSNAGNDNTREVCIDVITECPYDASIPNINNENCTIPVVKCTLLNTALNFNDRKATFTTEVSSSNDAVVTVNSYEYDFGDGTTQSVVSSEFSNTVMHTYEDGEFEASVVVNYTAPSESGVTEQSVECSAKIKNLPVGQQKNVYNITQDLRDEDAENKRVAAGDQIEFTLTTINSNDYEIQSDIEDYVGDLLDYADLDIAVLTEEGGRFDESSKKVVWDNVVLPANSSVETRFLITMKDPIPATNRPNDQGGDFDCVISNEYGNRLSLDVACPAVKSIETLPNTGPGTSILAVTGITGVVGYFFARARLFNKELELIRTDYATTGGM